MDVVQVRDRNKPDYSHTDSKTEISGHLKGEKGEGLAGCRRGEKRGLWKPELYSKIILSVYSVLSTVGQRTICTVELSLHSYTFEAHTHMFPPVSPPPLPAVFSSLSVCVFV